MNNSNTLILEPSTFLFLAISLFLLLLWYLLYRETRKFRKIIDAVSAEHKLYSSKVTILQTGYIRMRVETVAANAFSVKSYYRILVNVPAGRDSETTKATVDTINGIAKALDSEGLLVSCRMGINSADDDSEESKASQCVFPLDIVVNEKITPGRFEQLYDSLLKSIMDNGCNEIEHFTIRGIDTGTTYKHYRGNLCIGMIECLYDSHVVFNMAFDRSVFLGPDEQEYDEKQYNELRDSIGEGGVNMTLDEAADYVRQIVKKTGKGINANMVRRKNQLSIPISSRKASGCLYLTNQNGLWWIYSYGNLIEVATLSTESEAEAARMIVRLLTNIIDTLRDS